MRQGAGPRPEPVEIHSANGLRRRDFDIFISHAREDKATIARPIFEACERLGLKAFLDEEHIGWGESFTKRINTALGAARTVVAVVSSNSVSKEWPIAEMNTALALEISGHKNVLPVMVGQPDLSKLPLIRSKNWMVWDGDAHAVARRLRELITSESETKQNAPPSPAMNKAPAPQPSLSPWAASRPASQPVITPPPPRSWLKDLFKRR